MNKIRVFEAFAGYGSQSIALRNIGVPYEVVAISEVDKYAIQAYEAIHGKVNNLGDISKIDVSDIPEHDLFTYSFPCQDLSVAGKQRGLGEGTRSGLLYECEKIIEHCRPKYLLLENVKNLVGKKFRPQFYEWLRYLRSLGYTNYAQVLNAKDYGIPQNRERVFVVSIYGEHKPYKFPTPIQLDKCIGDILEGDVDKKYYIKYNKPLPNLDFSKDIIGRLELGNYDVNNRLYGLNSCAFTIRAKMPDQKILELPCIAASRGRNPNNPSSRKSGEPTEQRLEFNTEGISNTLTTVQKDNYVVEATYRQSKILQCDIQQNVRVRKHKVDIEKLKYTLQHYKKVSKLTINDIAGALNVTKTTVEHWFRSDNCFSIPDENIWLDLKTLLNIKTDEFDKSIMEFEIKPNEYDISNRVYHEYDISPTLTATSGNEAKKIVSRDYRIRKLTPRECFRLMGMNDNDIDKIQQSGISNSQQYKMAGNSIVVNVLEEIFKKLFK